MTLHCERDTVGTWLLIIFHLLRILSSLATRVYGSCEYFSPMLPNRFLFTALTAPVNMVWPHTPFAP